MQNALIKRSLAEEVAAQIQQQIAAGHYLVGDKLPVEADLMTEFGVGRSSIREAIKSLANSGLLRVQQGLGTFVEDDSGIKEPLAQRLKRSSVKEIDEVRQLLEMKIAENAALKRTAKDIKKMKQLLDLRDAAAEADNAAESIEADISFHIAIAEASGNEILCDMYKSFAGTLKKHFLKQYTDASSFRETAALHRNLLNSIIDKNPIQAWHAAALINGHITG